MLYDGLLPTPEHWKLGYGPALGLLLVVLSGLLPALAAALLIGAFGFICVLLDSRSLGGFSLLTAGLVFMHHMATCGTSRGTIKRMVGLGIGIALAAVLLNAAIHLSDDEFADRRDESNVGRLVLLSVGLQAVLDSPLIGYGSFAAEPRYVELMRREAARASVGRKKTLGMPRSMLPHAQWLQAWIEGGLAGAVFFLMYGWGIVTSLFRIAFRHVAAETTALYGFLLVGGLWNLLASPFLGSHRVSIAMTVVVIGLLSCKKKATARSPRLPRAGIAVGAG
jgi:O-antigen ligase